MAKQFLFALLIVLVAGGGYFLWTSQHPAPEPSIPEEQKDVFGAPEGVMMEDGMIPESGETEGAQGGTQGGAAPSTAPTTGGAGPQPGTYTMAQIATHNTESSCWSVIRGGVYDLTSWIARHPGGKQAIMGLCGKDGTAAFERQHGGSGRPESTLAGFKIGVLAQ